MTLYDRVKEKAKALGKNISQVEKEAGIANGTISGWVSGKPYAETLQKVASVLNTKMEDLLEG